MKCECYVLQVELQRSSRFQLLSKQIHICHVGSWVVIGSTGRVDCILSHLSYLPFRMTQLFGDGLKRLKKLWTRP